MKIVIIADDSVVGVDGVFHKFDFVIDSNIHAIHWDGIEGEIEFKNKLNEKLDSFSAYQHLIVEMQISLDAEQADSLAALESRSNSTLRQELIPNVNLQLEALYEARKGDSSKLDAIDVVITNLKIQYPDE